MKYERVYSKQEAAIKEMQIQQTAHLYKQKSEYYEWKYGMLRMEIQHMENVSKHIDNCVVCWLGPFRFYCHICNR